MVWFAWVWRRWQLSHEGGVRLSRGNGVKGQLDWELWLDITYEVVSDGFYRITLLSLHYFLLALCCDLLFSSSLSLVLDINSKQ